MQDKFNIEHLAKLSRLDLNTNQKELFSSQLEEIVEFISQLDNFTSQAKAIKHIDYGITRHDEIQESLDVMDAVSGTKSILENQFKIQSILDKSAT